MAVGLLPAGAMAGWDLRPLKMRRITTAYTHLGHLGVRSANQLEPKISDSRT